MFVMGVPATIGVAVTIPRLIAIIADHGAATFFPESNQKMFSFILAGIDQNTSPHPSFKKLYLHPTKFDRRIKMQVDPGLKQICYNHRVSLKGYPVAISNMEQ